MFALSNAVSRLLSGFLLDRVFSPNLGVATLVAAGIGAVILSGTETFPLVIVAIALCGVAIGLEADLLPFLVSRYFGTQDLGEIVGYAYLSFSLGTGTVGPLVMGNSQTFLRSFTPALIACAVALAICAGLLVALGPYRFPAQHHAQTEDANKPTALARAS